MLFRTGFKGVVRIDLPKALHRIAAPTDLSEPLLYMAGKRGARYPENENFPVLNSGQSEISHLLRDGPGCSKLLVGSLQTGSHHFSVVIFIATADAVAGVGKSAAPKSPWTSVTHIPEELRELWVATDRQTETVVLQEGFLIVHPPSGVLVAGSNHRMRAAMTRQLEPLTQHMRLPPDEHVPMDPPHFNAYLTTIKRAQYLTKLVQQALSPHNQTGASMPTMNEIPQPMEIETMVDTAAEGYGTHRGQGVPHMVPGATLQSGEHLLTRPPSALTYAVRRLRLHYQDGLRLSNAMHQMAANYSNSQEAQLIAGLLDPFDRFLTHPLGLLNSEYPE